MEAPSMSEEGVTIVKTTTWSAGPGCHGNCGVLAHVKEGKVIKVEGDPDHPWNQGRLCPRCLAMPQYMYHPDRLQYPQKRVGKRGENVWERISWEEAFDLIEKRMKDIKAEHGPESMVFLQGTGRDIGGWISMLAYAYGSPNWVFGLSGISCYTPRLLVMWLTQGDFCVGDAAQWHAKRYDDPEYKVPESITIWGQNLPASCPDGFFSHWYVDLMKKGSELVVIDPRCTWLASKAKIWLQIRPGTDGALALAYLNVIINEKLYDESYVQKWTNAHHLVRIDGKKPALLRESDLKAAGSASNFVVWDHTAAAPSAWLSDQQSYDRGNVEPAFDDEFDVAAADGSTIKCKTVWRLFRERVAPYTPEKAEEITWAPAKDIAAAARLYAKSKPAILHWGLPIDTIQTTVPTAQAINHLWCLTGNLDNPGGNVIARYPNNVVTYPYTSGTGVLSLPPEVHAKRIGAWKYPALRDFRAWAHPDMMLEQVFSEDPYPVKGMWIQTANPLACTGLDPAKWLAALEKLDFTVCVDLFMTPTAMMADLVLPAATFLEKDSLKGWWAPLQAIKKVVTVGECKSDIEINMEMARRFNPDFPWKTPQEMFDTILKNADAGMTYQELCDKTWVLPEKGHSSAPYFRYEKGQLREDGKPGFKTPSGKIELYSSWLEKWDLDPLPFYEEPPYSPVSTPELYKEYPLILTTGRRSVASYHSEHRQIPWLREIDPDAILEIHPKTARELDICHGETVWIENQFGKCKRVAAVTPAIHPKVVMAPHGWWMPEQEGSAPHLYGIWDVNINQLIPMDHTGASGLGCIAKSLLCKVYKMEGK
jgi:anaerobic selenocysteine-containing dehydrogenase